MKMNNWVRDRPEFRDLEVRVVQPSSLSELGTGILVPHASWSGPSILALFELAGLLRALPARPPLFIADYDRLGARILAEFGLLHGRGEAFWIEGGHILAAALQPKARAWPSQVQSWSTALVERSLVHRSLDQHLRSRLGERRGRVRVCSVTGELPTGPLIALRTWEESGWETLRALLDAYDETVHVVDYGAEAWAARQRFGLGALGGCTLWLRNGELMSTVSSTRNGDWYTATRRGRRLAAGEPAG